MQTMNAVKVYTLLTGHHQNQRNNHAVFGVCPVDCVVRRCVFAGVCDSPWPDADDVVIVATPCLVMHASVFASVAF